MSGSPAALRAFRAAIEKRAAARGRRDRGQDPRRARLRPVLEPIPVALGFHHPDLAPAVDLVRDWAEACGLDAGLAEHLAQAICVDTVDWPRELTDAVGAAHPLGRRPRPRRPLRQHDRPRPARPRRHRRPGRHHDRSRPALHPRRPRHPRPPTGRPTPPAWSTARRHARRRDRLHPPHRQVADPARRHDADHRRPRDRRRRRQRAASGPSSPAVARSPRRSSPTNVAELTDCSTRAAPRSSTRCSSTPTCGSCRSAASASSRGPAPPARRSTASSSAPASPSSTRPSRIIEELHEAGISHVVFKPGTVKQIRQVLAIAKAVDTPVIVQIEGGNAGGHHSWEDLDELLLATYAELRAVDNLVVCVGGGIGTPDRAVAYLPAPGPPPTAMPRCRSTASSSAPPPWRPSRPPPPPPVKQLLVEHPRHRRERRLGRRRAGRRRHGLGPQPARRRHPRDRQHRLAHRPPARRGRRRRRGRAARRDEIVEALDRTAKPYFGDVAAMTYGSGCAATSSSPARAPPAPTAPPRARPWLDVTLRNRFDAMLDSAPGRVHPGDLRHRGAPRPADVEDRPGRRARRAGRGVPRGRHVVLHPADVPVLRRGVPPPRQAGQLRAGHRRRRAPLVALGLAVAGARRALRRRRGLRHPRPGRRRRHHRSTSPSPTCSTASRPPSSTT